ncbi:hypothetical protein SAMN04490204_0555 [Pseudomonas thivervalensis]|nr:hypothetical protein SAMN04490204_0555 [Pseudomonas thivervalensis]
MLPLGCVAAPFCERSALKREQAPSPQWIVPASKGNLPGCNQQVQHIIGMPLQLIIIGMPQSPIIFIIRAQQFFIMSMFMPAIGMTLHIMQSAITVHSITHFIDGIGMPIIGIGIITLAIGMAMLAGDMHIMLMLPQCIIIGMPQFIIICIMSALFLNMAMSMPAAGIILHIMPSSIMSQVMVAIIIGMPIMGIIGMLAFIGMGICIAFIMVVFPVSSRVGQADGADSKDWPGPDKMAIEQQE